MITLRDRSTTSKTLLTHSMLGKYGSNASAFCAMIFARFGSIVNRIGSSPRWTCQRTFCSSCTRLFAAVRIFSDTQARQYFERFIAYGEHEVFADIGAFDGITSQAFAQRCPRYAGIHVFEPNDQNLEVARQRLGNDERVHFVAAAVGAREGLVRFDRSGSSSRIAEHGALEVRVEPLDKYRDAAFTFLKMDIEGAESSAISGAAEVIRTHHPKMAISVYHNPGDIVNIPHQVLSIRDDYDIRLRHYTEGFTETVMYFVPKT